jgi:hypothetical protein
MPQHQNKWHGKHGDSHMTSLTMLYFGVLIVEIEFNVFWPGFQVAEHLSRSFSLPDSPIGPSVVIQRGKSFPKSLQIKVFMQKTMEKPWKNHRKNMVTYCNIIYKMVKFLPCSMNKG